MGSASDTRSSRRADIVAWGPHASRRLPGLGLSGFGLGEEVDPGGHDLVAGMPGTLGVDPLAEHSRTRLPVCWAHS